MIKDKNKYSKVSYTYVPNSDTSFILYSVENDTINISIEDLKAENSTESNILKPDIDNEWRWN